MDNLEQIVTETYNEVINQECEFHWIKQGDQQIRLFKSLNSKRLPYETFGEYKIRMMINRKMIKLHKKGTK